MKRPRSPLGLKLLIILGIAFSVTGIVLHWSLPERFEKIELLPIAIGFTLALSGAYWLDPDRADKLRRGVTEAGADVVHSVVELRTGDRRTDPVVRVEKTTPVDDPAATPAVKVTVSQEGGSSAPITATESIPDPANPQAEPLLNPVQWKDGKDDGVL